MRCAVQRRARPVAEQWYTDLKCAAQRLVPEDLELTAEQWYIGEDRRFHCTLKVQGHSAYHPELQCQPYVYVALSYAPWHGRKAQWHIDCQLEQADESRSQWNHCTMYETLEEASQMAADFTLEAIPLLVESMRTGQLQETPGRRRSIDAQIHAAQDTADLRRVRDRYERLVRNLADATEAEAEVERDVLWAKLRAARSAYEEAYRKAEQAFHNAHDWREYRGGKR
jgi:hypothetical protein